MAALELRARQRDHPWLKDNIFAREGIVRQDYFENLDNTWRISWHQQFLAQGDLVPGCGSALSKRRAR